MAKSLISIIVPTRNRAEYLLGCLETCLGTDDPDLEVIVSNNASEDNTHEVVKGFKDKRLKYFETSRSVSMRQNFEFALSKAKGNYVLFIGDDDGVLPTGMATLRHLIDLYQPDAINWPHVIYKWPHPDAKVSGHFKLQAKRFFGGIKFIQGKNLLQRLCNADTTNYHDGVNIYHGCVAMRVIRKLQKRTSEYFQDQSPDVYAAIANLSALDSLLWVEMPLTIGGESVKSNGAAHSTATRSISQKKISSSFKNLADKDHIISALSPNIRVITAHTYAILNAANKLVFNGQLKINHARWRHKILQDMSKFPPEDQKSNMALLAPAFKKFDRKYQALPFTPVMKKHAGSKKKRQFKIHSRHTHTVATLAQWLDRVIGTPYKPKLGEKNSFRKYGQTLVMLARAQFYRFW